MGGSIGEQSVSLSHGQIILPSENVTAIFRIKELEEDNPNKELKHLTPFKLFYGVANVRMLFPIESYRYWDNHLEKEVYQKLEKEFGRKRKIVLPKKTVDEVAINYSSGNRQLLPNRKTGIIYKLRPINETKKEDFLGFNLHIASSNKDTYLQKGEIIIEYNAAVFRDSIVSRGDLHYDIPRNYKKEYSSRSGAIPQHFEVNIFDVSPNKFKIQWINPNSTDSCLQLLPSKKGIYGMQLYFKPHQLDKPIKIHLKNKGLQNLHYNYQSESMVSYDYVATDYLQYLSAKALMPATITNFNSEKIYQPYDTIQLVGKNFGRYSAVSFSSKGTQGHHRYRKVPESFMLSRSDTLIKMIIPPLTLKKRGFDLSEEWIPSNGKIMVTKGYGEFKVKTWSKQQIKIKNTAPNKAYNGN